MTVDTVWTELETDMEWRQVELRRLSNTVSIIKRASERDQFRRTMLVMLYAHVEGYCKVALSTYVRALNRQGLFCQDVIESIAAASFGDVFHALTYGDKKGRVFARTLPKDEGLSVFARQCEFVDRFSNLLGRPLLVPDSVVNTESNLGSQVLRRNLFRLGFPVDLLARHDLALDELRNRRNNIAHGSDSAIVRDREYEELRSTVFQVMDELALAVVDALENHRYKKNP